MQFDRFDDYDIPHKIVRIENGKDKSYLVELERLNKENATDCVAYIEIYTAMLHLEETAEMLLLKSYNQTVQLSYSNIGKIFKIKIKVSVDY